MAQHSDSWRPYIAPILTLSSRAIQTVGHVELPVGLTPAEIESQLDEMDRHWGFSTASAGF